MGCTCGSKKPQQTIAIDMSVTTIGSAAWVQILSKILYAAGSVEIFNGSSSAFALGVGSPGNETALPYTVIPGGTSGAVLISQTFAAGAALSAKSIGGVPTQGLLIFNFYG